MYVFMAVIALAGWFALALQLYIIITNNIANDTSVVDGVVKFSAGVDDPKGQILPAEFMHH